MHGTHSKSHTTWLSTSYYPAGCAVTSCFFNDKDRLEYLRLLKEQGKRFGIILIAYCLMTNHVHLIAIPEDEASLSRGIGEKIPGTPYLIIENRGSSDLFFKA